VIFLGWKEGVDDDSIPDEQENAIQIRVDPMPSFDFAVIVAGKKMKHKQILDATDALGEAACTDATLSGHEEGMELMFTRSARSLQAAITSAIHDVEKAGFRVTRIEMDREAIPK